MTESEPDLGEHCPSATPEEHALALEYDSELPWRYVVYACKGGKCDCGNVLLMCGAEQKTYIAWDVRFELAESEHNSVCVAEFVAPTGDAARHIYKFLGGHYDWQKEKP